ncbi:diguanylate cyclase domain-containing protein [Thiomicrospira microaerophila]|uniref:diguanylate cyclase domain-containing protein n=1 Tax=Thiomicrospira microaerophila TaxID=406020 RepID=UPI0005C915DE|nr:diguanylate cyclase [Thiomicrospira microaerophila]
MPRRISAFSYGLCLILLVSLQAHAQPVPMHLTPVQLQLKWQHQFQFAGYYAALEKGYYQDAGLDVTLIEAQAGMNLIQKVLEGKAEFGVGTSEVLLNYHQGDPLVVLAVIMQHSPLAFATLASSGITNIHQLANETMMIEPNSLELFAYLKSEGIGLKQINQVMHNHVIEDLIDGKVKAMSVYTTDEPFEFAQLGIETQLFRPTMAGIDFYGDNLFTSQAMIQQQPELVERFLEASLQGWRYAMQYPDEIIDLILTDYSSRKSRAHLAFEAQKMREIMRPDLVEIGYMNPGRWHHIAQTYAQLGILPEHITIQGLLYQNSDLAYQQLKTQFYYALVLLVSIGLLAGIFYHQFYLANLRHKQFESLFLNAPISLIEIDQHGTIFNWNREAQNTFHYASEEVVGKNVFTLLVHHQDLDKVESVIKEAFENKKITFSENKNVRKDGQSLLSFWSNMPFASGHRKTQRLLCMARDITLEKQMEAKLYQAAHYDELTGLPNRVLLLSLLKQTLADAKRYQSKVAILFIDLNDFKAINDTCGHYVGDQVLKQTGRRLEQSLRENDVIGRLAGDEFVAIVKDINESTDIQIVISHIMAAVQTDIVVDELRLSISASIGFSLYPQDGQDIQQLLTLADESMYKVKAASKNRA